MADRALVKNAADPSQVKYAVRKERQRSDRLREAMLATMSVPAGRIVLWELLERLGVFRSIWDPSARIHYNAGRQDAGHELMALCVETSGALYEQMEREARAWKSGNDRETEAVQLGRQNSEDRNG